MSSEKFEQVPVLDQMYCISPDYNLSGSPFSDIGYSSVLIAFYYEYQNNCPITFEEYTDNILFSVLRLYVFNEYFNPSDIENPIGTVINNDYDHYFSPQFLNRYSLKVQKNNYEIETGGLFSQNKEGEFYKVQGERQDRHNHDLNTTTKYSLEFQIYLDPEEKQYSVQIYRVIDAIGTLGGVHEILLWCIMLIYGSLRKNVYLFSIINRLIQTEQLQDTANEENKNQ